MNIKQFIEDKKFKKQSSSPLFDNDYILVSDLEALMEGKVVLPRELTKEMIIAFNDYLRDCNEDYYQAFQNAFEAMIATQEGE